MSAPAKRVRLTVDSRQAGSVDEETFELIKIELLDGRDYRDIVHELAKSGFGKMEAAKIVLNARRENMRNA